MNYWIVGLFLMNLAGGITYILQGRPVLGMCSILASGISICTLYLGMGWK